jgi:hypothetical protein
VKEPFCIAVHLLCDLFVLADDLAGASCKLARKPHGAEVGDASLHRLGIIREWLRTSGITAGIPVAAPLHHMDERLMHPEERRKQWRRAMQAD